MMTRAFTLMQAVEDEHALRIERNLRDLFFTGLLGEAVACALRVLSSV